MSLLVITPRLPPAIDGIGDYCRQLWQYCTFPSNRSDQDLPIGLITRSEQNPSPNPTSTSDPAQATPVQQGSTIRPWQFLVLDGVAETRKFWPEIKVDQIQKSKDKLLSQLESSSCDTILLQYVGYGFEHDGAPFWLVQALADWKARQNARRLIVMFHETWSSGQIWQRTFWQMPKQKRCVKQLLDMASIVVTSMEPNATSLRALGFALPIHIIPIGSSFPSIQNKDKNWRHLLIFGKEPSRLRALSQHQPLIKSLIKSQLIDSIVLAGQNPGGELASIDEFLGNWSSAVEVVKVYNFTPMTIPDTIRKCGLAIMHTQSTNLLKSTAFHLAIQLGQVSITRWERPADPPFLRNEHYLAYKDSKIDDLELQLVDEKFLHRISENCTSIAERYLSWPHLAKQWSELLYTHSPIT
jgi:hypothetical protein